MNLIDKETRFLLIGKDNSENLKRIKRRLNKQKTLHLFKQRIIKENLDDNKNVNNNKRDKNAIMTPYEKLLDRYQRKKQERLKKNSDILEILKNYLIEVKRNKNSGHVGILTDDNVINHNLTDVPEAPNTWDILFLQYDVKKYHFDKNTTHWCKLDILDSKHFIINNKSLDNILTKLKDCKTWGDFINLTNTLDCYGITQSFFSEHFDNYIHFPFDKWNSKSTSEHDKDNILIEYSKTGFEKLKKMDVQPIDWQKLINYFDNKMLNVSPTDKYVMLPSISLICLVTDVKKFLHLLHTFLKIDYPMDKLELIIVDDMDIDKKIKGMIPNDSRIKFINIKNKGGNGQGTELPFGYKLNIGAKYANHNLLFHFFDTNIYIPSNFRQIVKCYLLSKKDMIIGDSILEYQKEKDQSSRIDMYNISNMIYSKNYWLVNMFQEIDDPNVILYKFMSFRKSTIVKLASIYWGFKLKGTEHKNEHGQSIHEEKYEIKLNLETLISDDVKESYNLITS